MIFQEPMSSLNPSLKCGFQVQEILLQHTDLSTSETKGDTFAIRESKMPDPEIVFDKYPHEISGGQKQRVMIAMAIACKPQLLIADEPTTALDVTVQRNYPVVERHSETGMSIIFISHDLSLVSAIAH
jgi:peptide/nickel transport system ATP-binding protein